MLQNESHMEIGWVCRWRRIEQLTYRELESGFIFEESDLFLPLMGAMQAEEGFEEVAGGINVRDLKIAVFASQSLLLYSIVDSIESRPSSPRRCIVALFFEGTAGLDRDQQHIS